MNENCMHPLLSAFIEGLRRKNQITIEDLTSEAHISTKTSANIKKGVMPDLVLTNRCFIGF